MDDNRLSKRKAEILKAIVDAHITHGEPVGSKYLANEVGLTCSSATIRNEMADLKEMGYLIQPHTSAGSVPSELAYRYYVDALVKQYAETKSEIDEINDRLHYKLTEMDGILEEVSRLASSYTDYTGIAFKSGNAKVRVTKFDSLYVAPRDYTLVMMLSNGAIVPKNVHLYQQIEPEDLKRLTELINVYLVNLTSDKINMQLIARLEALMGRLHSIVHPTLKVIYEAMNEADSADIRVEGVNKLLKYPEYSDVSRLRDLLGVLEEKDKLLDVISTHQSTNDGINVYIGTENDSDVMQNTTLIFKNINVGGKTLAVGVIGPRRMDYEKVIGMINRLANGIDRMYSSGNLLTDGTKDD